MRHHVYLSPGMFGFGRLGSYNYFVHVERELRARFSAAGHELEAHVIEDLPTASVRRRSTRLAELIAQTSGGDLIHLVGHSTGGLDARLVASPATCSIPLASLGWLPRLRSVTTMNTPHFGTPLASFFATSNGQRMLAALSVLTVTGLAIGAQPLAAASVILGFMRGSDKVLPFKLRMLDRSVTSVVGLVDDARSPEVRAFLTAIEEDQGSMLQLSPESMDLVGAGFADRPGVVYQSTASMAPTPKPQRWLETFGHPWRAVSLALFFGLHRITATLDPRYPCAAMRDAAPWSGDANEAHLQRVLAASPPLQANDGVVPIRSQLWGRLVWAGIGDHLDVLGHYLDDRDPETVAPELRHRDWLTSGSNFTHASFTALIDAITTGMLDAAANS
ncbi:MAG: Lipase precursor [Deltaproteobacteria bacterium]|nr:Lipase precursor [Deltaproteobacteria bacterium]